MGILSRFLIVYLCLSSRKIECGLVGDVFSAFNPFNVLKHLERHLSSTTVAPLSSSTEKTKLVSVEETVFHLAPTLQTLFQPNDPVAKLNYIVCPLNAISLLAQILIGTHGTFHRYISSYLEFDGRTKRQVQVFELTKDDLYDKKLYHSAFHWKLKRLMNSIKSSSSSIVAFENAFIYNKTIQLVEHFRKHMTDYYNTEIIAVNPNEIDTRALEWIQFNEKRRNPFSAGADIEDRAVLCSKFKFVSTWDTPFKEELAEGPFMVSPFQEIKVKYLQATIKNTTYVDTNLFSLAVIPLKDHDFRLYVMLPTDKTSQIRHFSESLRDFEFFRTVQHKSEPVNIELEMPKIFPYVAELDLMEPIRDDFRDRGYSKLKYIGLNGAARNLQLTNSIHHLEISISNEGEQLKSALYETLHETVVQPISRQQLAQTAIDRQSGLFYKNGQPHHWDFVQYQLPQLPLGSMQPPQQPSESVQQSTEFSQPPQQSSESVQQQPSQFMQPPQQTSESVQQQPSQFMQPSQQTSESVQQQPSQFMQPPQQTSESAQQQPSQFMQPPQQTSESVQQQPSQFMQPPQQTSESAQQQPSQFMQPPQQSSESVQQQPSQFMQPPQQTSESAQQQPSQFMQPPQQNSESLQQQPSQFMQPSQQTSESAQQQPSQFMQPPQQSSESIQQQPSQFMQSTPQPSQFLQPPQQPSADAMRTVKFKVNSPFTFFIMHEKTKMVLVWGSIENPSKL